MSSVDTSNVKPFSTNRRYSNPFARHASYREVADLAFAAEILPTRKKPNVRKFNEAELRMRYEHLRDWLDPVEDWTSQPSDSAPFSYRHEKYLDYLFWDNAATNPVVCVLGSVGSGKSTLIDYYLRCHCPTRGEHRDKFERKIVIKFDCRADPNSADLKMAFFHSAQDDIIEQCDERNFDIKAVIRQQGFSPKDIKDWVWTALKCLSSSARNQVAPFDYIVVFVDNLDQCPVDVQISIIATIEHYISDPNVSIWRFFLPLWPGTYAGLRAANVNLLNGAKTFFIGSIHSYDILRNRNQSIYSLPTLDRLPEIRGQREEYLKGCDFKSYVLSTLQQIKRNHGDCLNDITNGDLRRTLAIIGDSVHGQRAFQVWRARQNETAPEQRTYRFDTLLSLLCGENEYLRHDLNRVANVFEIGNPTSKSYAMAGFHGISIMSLLEHSDRVYKSVFVSQMRKLGYQRNLINAVYRDLFALGLFHEEPNGRSVDDPLLRPHRSPCRAYLKLATSAEYLVAIAQVTPVDDEARQNMANIEQAVTDEFIAETLKSMEFIRFVRRAEDEFSGRLPAGKDVHVPIWWSQMARSYYSRLKYLRESGMLPNITDANWIPILNDALFRSFHF